MSVQHFLARRKALWGVGGELQRLGTIIKYAH